MTNELAQVRPHDKRAFTPLVTSGDRTQLVRDIALSMFVREGFANVSLRDLGKRVGIQPGSLYHHIESKQSLLFDLIHEHLDGLVVTIEQRVNKTRHVSEKLKVFIELHLSSQHQQRHCAKLLTLELRSLDASNRAQVKPLVLRYRECLSGIIQTGMNTGLFANQNLDTSVNVVLTMLNSVALWYRDGLGQPFEAVVAQMIRMVFGVLKAT